MADNTRQQLQRAYELIKAGHKQEAGQILVNILKQDRNNADAWWLLANASTQPDKISQALQQVLRLRPDDERARRMLAKVSGSSASAPPPAAPPAPAAPAQNPPSEQTVISQRPAAPVEDDPFAAPTPSSRAATPVEDDPFADDPFAAPADDPFGDPFADDPFAAPPPRSRTAAPADDPFADDPFASPPPRSRSTARDPLADDPFADDPFASAPSRSRGAPPRDAYAPPPPPRAKKGTNPVVMILAIVGIIGIVGCAACAILTASGAITFGNLFNQALQTAMPEGTFQAVMGELEVALTSMPNDATVQAAFGEIGTGIPNQETMQAAFGEVAAGLTDLPPGTFEAAMEQAEAMLTAMPEGGVAGGGIIGELTEEGSIEPGQTVNGELEDGFANHAYTFTASAGQTYTFNAEALNDSLDTKLNLLDANDNVVGYNDDIDFQAGNTDSQLVWTAPADGTYRIVVGAFGMDAGPYELRMSQ